MATAPRITADLRTFFNRFGNVMRQFLPILFAPGDFVSVRGARWIVDDIASFADCALLHLSGREEANRRSGCRLLYPFDRPKPEAGARRLRIVKRRRWMNALRLRLAEVRPFGTLRAAAGAEMEILPFQLEPAIAFLRGMTARALIADEVGLGKTIQAGLILAELANRGLAERVLILTPAGLREQWADELDRRFGVHAAVVDVQSIMDRLGTLPPDVNPWAIESVSIASLDFVKRPEVLQALEPVVWDLLIVDEAHLAASAPQRGAAVRALARRSRCLVLLTATPHDGIDESFVSLCEIGRSGPEDHMLMFRRTRQDTGMSLVRKTHLLPVNLSEHERLMLRLLDDYAKRLWRGGDPDRGRTQQQLIASVLTKRALSSASSLARSVRRRLEVLGNALEASIQVCLPLGPDADVDDADAEPALEAPGLEDRDDERACLEKILNAATRACGNERKLAALMRLLRRTSEPAIVFTEYRDTLETVAAALRPARRVTLLHGGVDSQQRRRAIEAFTTGAADVLLATDAGCEGLNLQTTCRLVIDLELPWNPVRLEQRVGRVDRIGQRRTVHAIHLYGRGTAESRVLARLFQRLERIRLRLGRGNEPLPVVSETTVTEAMIMGAALQHPQTPVENVENVANVPTFHPHAGLQTAAALEAARVRSLRALQRVRDMPWQPPGAARDGLLATAVYARPSLRRAVGTPCAICFVRARIIDAGGRLLEQLLVPVRLDDSVSFDVSRARDVRRAADDLLTRCGEAVLAAATAHARERLADIAAAHGAGLLLARAKQSAIARSVARERLCLIQPGLFDGRAIKRHERDDRARLQAQTDITARMASLDASASIRLAEPLEPVLLLLVQNG